MSIMAAALSEWAVEIDHNPDCGTSRNTLAMIRNAGIAPTIIECLDCPPSREELVELLQAIRMPMRGLLRRKGTPYDELELDRTSWADDQLLDFMMRYPILMNRPIVVTALGTRLRRPSEPVLEILPARQLGGSTKEDGEPVIDATGDRASP
ncbi:MAG: arsenate reductase (glutaredoxin) [Burkholderiaceae bacterium]